MFGLWDSFVPVSITLLFTVGISGQFMDLMIYNTNILCFISLQYQKCVYFKLRCQYTSISLIFIKYMKLNSQTHCRFKYMTQVYQYIMYKTIFLLPTLAHTTGRIFICFKSTLWVWCMFTPAWWFTCYISTLTFLFVVTLC